MAMVVPPVDHDCVLKDVVVAQANEIARLKHDVDQLKKALIGPKTERSKMPRVDAGKRRTPEERLAKRRANAAAKQKLETVRTPLKVPPEAKTCPDCGLVDAMKPVGTGRETTVFEFIPARWIRHIYVQEVLRCDCRNYVVTAPGAPKVIARGRYSASFLAHLAVAKCADSIPIYRIEKDYQRQGIPIARSTMTSLLHTASEITKPIWVRVLDNIKVRAIVQADETRLRMQKDKPGKDGKPKNGFVWTFVAEDDHGGTDVAYVYAADRSGDTPKRVLGDTKGWLLVDEYSGYNHVAKAARRKRAGCHAHLRRYFHDALKTAPIAQEAIDLILELYLVEYEAEQRGFLKTAAHLKLRQAKSTPIRTQLKKWLDKQKPRHRPTSPIGKAIKYALNHWEDFGRFLDDARINLDNNASERSLRRVALGRKNFLFVGDVDAGTNIAGLYTLVATCEARGINPFAYLADVIPRVEKDMPDAELEALLPANWVPLPPPPS
jgi:transposase